MPLPLVLYFPVFFSPLMQVILISAKERSFYNVIFPVAYYLIHKYEKLLNLTKFIVQKYL